MLNILFQVKMTEATCLSPPNTNVELPSSNRDYGKQEYWETRYARNLQDEIKTDIN